MKFSVNTSDYIAKLPILFTSKKYCHGGKGTVKGIFFKHQVKASVPGVIFNLMCCSGKITNSRNKILFEEATNDYHVLL